MTDAQFGALLAVLASGLAAIGASIKFGIGRVVKSNDAGTAALIANTASNAVLSLKVDTLVSSNKDLGAKLDNISDWMEEATPPPQTPPIRPHRGNTPARGVKLGPGEYGFITRARTRGEDDQ